MKTPGRVYARGKMQGEKENIVKKSACGPK